MDRAAFLHALETALENAYDRAVLESNPLARWLSDTDAPLPAERLHRILVEAIAELRPAAGSPPSAIGWRRHRYLERRYLGGLSHKATAGELALSLRQAHRVRADSLDAVAGRLWQKYVDPGASPDPAADGQSIPVRTAAAATLPRLRTTLEDEVARLDAEPSGAPTDLAREIRAVVEVIQPLASQRDVAIQADAAVEGPLVGVERAVLRQTLLLLAMSALERQQDGRIFVAAAAANEATVDVVFRPGSPESLDGSAHRDSRLAAARHLVEAQAGTLEVLAVEDRACFRLTLPPPKADTVLTVDDNPDLARLFDLYLQGTRYQVIRAKTGPSALRLAAKHRPDVITLDVMMPFQDGWEIFRQLRDNPLTKAIPIVVCSILPEKDLAVALGAADFLAKPVTRDSLIATLDRCLGPESAAS